MNKIKKIWRILGPGFLYAGAAIGVSHLVQSTRAGADYGFLLIGVVLLSNFFKYPFFEAGPRYAAATGETLIDGYRRIGKWAVALFAILTVATAFSIQAAVTMVTAVLLKNMTGETFNLLSATAILLIFCALVLFLGKYKLLDNLIKYVVIVLSVCSLIAFFRAFNANHQQDFWPEWELTDISFVFIFALMGWMPAPIDISVWHSMWTLEKKKNNGSLSVKSALTDFHIGYWVTTGLALVFLALGALVLYGKGIDLMKSNTDFANQFIGIYTNTLGQWTYPIIAVAAFATMFSTTITVYDGAPRVFQELMKHLVPDIKSKPENVYKFSLIIIGLGAFFIIWKFSASLQMLITIATIASFITAPMLAFLNHHLIFGKHMPVGDKPGTFTKWVSIFSIALLTAFVLIYLAYLLKLFSL